MANQMIETGSAVRGPARTAVNWADRRTVGHRVSHKITDRALIRKVRAANGRLKRAFDILVATLALTLLAPLFATVALFIKMNDGGPVFYKHTRVGRQGKRFKCLKFRTMAVDAEERLAHILLTDSQAALEWENTQKLRVDPRITRFGVFLRKSSIDELPQLWNVLNGTMSLIGPRPERPEFVRRYAEEIPGYLERLQVKPGLTGLAQVNGEYHTSPAYKLKYDLAYIYNYSLVLDLKIMAETVKVMVTRRGV